jgi:hypothetical protein
MGQEDSTAFVAGGQAVVQPRQKLPLSAEWGLTVDLRSCCATSGATGFPQRQGKEDLQGGLPEKALMC